ncbi:ubiquitin-conjugating enzyme E2 U isoform X7 [Vicugna pacos]|uniref:Ubiquitin-conjugating enzyme E2 U isoform X7 n=1 Tax=Vicugna pacos TaxID=30538 RepID=A0ABM5EFE5_VICPA
MLSRADYLLQRDFRELKKNNYEGITAFPISEDMMEWEADIEGLQNTIWHVKGDSSEPLEDPDKVIRSVKSISFNDYYKTWSEIATSKAMEYYRTPLLEDPNFVGEYYKRKKNEGKHPTECHLKYTAAMARLAREKKRPYKAGYPAERRYHCTTPTQTFSDSQAETNTVTKMSVIKERQKRKVLPDDVNTNEPWEEEVASLVAWTNTLDTNALED